MKINQKDIDSEYNAGYKNGLLDKEANIRANVVKMSSRPKDRPLVSAYWQGYSDAFLSIDKKEK